MLHFALFSLTYKISLMLLSSISSTSFAADTFSCKGRTCFSASVSCCFASSAFTMRVLTPFSKTSTFYGIQSMVSFLNKHSLKMAVIWIQFNIMIYVAMKLESYAVFHVHLRNLVRKGGKSGLHSNSITIFYRTC